MSGAKLGLRVSQSQHLTLTPQLRQAIKLLQLSGAELEIEVREALETNPTLELSEDGFDTPLATGETPDAISDPYDWDRPSHTATTDFDRHSESQANNQSDAGESNEYEFENLASNDDFDQHNFESSGEYTSEIRGSGVDFDAQEHGDYLQQANARPELREHLMWQLNLAPFSNRDRQIALTLIDAIEPDGYLREDVLSTQSILLPEVHAEVAEIESVRHRLQHFEPIGVASRNLQECLRVQLHSLPKDTPGYVAAEKLLQQSLEQIPRIDHRKLSNQIQCSEAETQIGLDLIRHLDPRPGGAFERNATEYIAPDVVAYRDNGSWKVRLAEHAQPKVRISNHYTTLARNISGEAAQYLRGQLQEAKWLLKALSARGETLLRVSQCIAREQTAFLDHGAQGMRPLTLRNIATQLDLHESTISRATTRKYLYTPRGTFELKFFFSSGITTEEGGEASSTAIRALIKQMIEQENPHKPLSDQVMAEELKKQGIPVARRTVAKYREGMNIPTSNERSNRMTS